MDLAVSTRHSDRVTTLAIAGDIDLATRDQLATVLINAVAAADAAIEVDLSQVEFLDSSGIAALIKGRTSADAAGVGFRVTGVTDFVQQILVLSGVWEFLAGEQPRTTSVLDRKMGSESDDPGQSTN